MAEWPVSDSGPRPHQCLERTESEVAVPVADLARSADEHETRASGRLDELPIRAEHPSTWSGTDSN